MSWKSLGRLLSGIKGAYNDINPATLTGAIDVIVVEQKDGSFTCGPFHVRFGKLTAFSPTDKAVEVYVNGEFVDFLQMSLGSAGDAYFVDSSGSTTDEFLTADPNDCPGFTYDDSWSEIPVRRHSRKVRRDSAMSEPGTESNSIKEDIDELCGTSYEVSSDCEASSDRLRDCRKCRNSVGDKFGSDSQLDESLKDTASNYSYDWNLTKYQPRGSSSCVVKDVTKSDVQDPHLKNFTHEKEVYLEELVTSEVDQNIKEVYIYPPSHGNIPSQCQGSCNTTDSNCVDYGYRSDNEHSPRSMSPIHPHDLSLRLSLCGGLSSDNPCSEGKFVEHIVSYEEFIRDPNTILSNPNLVVYFNGRYCNWQVTAPSIVSLLAFQTQLPYLTLQKLENQYLPKKQSRRTSWFSWGASQTRTVATNSVIPAKEVDNVEEKRLDSSSQPPQVHTTHRVTKINRLSSSEVSRLKLKPGRNDIEFRVTTKYQGTCTCSASIYYWHCDLLGHLLPMVGRDWTHSGVARLYNRVKNNGYQFLYLSARALGQADSCFEQAAAHLTEIAYSLDSNTLLYFYARYKQATVGPCNVSKPGIFDVSGRKKWWAWHDLGNMPIDEAQKQYIDKLQELNPEWKPSNEKQRSVYVSRMINLNPNSNESPLVSDTDHPIFNIIKQNDIDSLNRLLSANGNEVHSTDENGMTPLHWASDRGFTDLVSTLVKYNANIDAKDAEGQTPLHYACSCGHDDVIQVLLKSNADIYATDNEGSYTYDLYDGNFHTLFSEYLHGSTSWF
ncbi:unnamed protein product [Schistosoma intercalatum]|nr:unnamed protein product [Schistosoma intercalatum]